jgi:hypothetical protein
MTASEPEQKGGLIVGLGRSLISALPPSFIMLVLFNAAFMYFIIDQVRQRDEMARELFNRCMAIALGSAAP